MEKGTVKMEEQTIGKGKIKKIEAYMTTDGNTYEDVGEAMVAQGDINLREKLDHILDGIWYTGINYYDILDGLMKNREELKEIFK